jgi:hypothetical protein
MDAMPPVRPPKTYTPAALRHRFRSIAVALGLGLAVAVGTNSAFAHPKNVKEVPSAATAAEMAAEYQSVASRGRPAQIEGTLQACRGMPARHGLEHRPGMPRNASPTWRGIRRAVSTFPDSARRGHAGIMAPGLIDQARFVTGCRDTIMGGAQPTEI